MSKGLNASRRGACQGTKGPLPCQQALGSSQGDSLAHTLYLSLVISSASQSRALLCGCSPLHRVHRALNFAVSCSMRRVIVLDNASFYAQCCRHDVGSFFLAILVFPS